MRNAFASAVDAYGCMICSCGFEEGSNDTDTDGGDHHVQCPVTGGSCAVGSVNQANNAVTVTWTLPGAAGDHEIMIAVGNGHYFGTTTDRVQVQ
jgi:hypothetical protein